MHQKTLEQRIEENISYEPMSGCWLWTGAITPWGYGCLSINGKFVYAHRASYAATKGPIPAKMEIDHRCHVRCCVNPDHLRIATRAENGWNSVKPKNNTSGYKGVRWMSKQGKWRAQIGFKGKLIYLGCYDDPVAAHNAYCWAAREYHKDFANTGGRVEDPVPNHGQTRPLPIHSEGPSLNQPESPSETICVTETPVVARQHERPRAQWATTKTRSRNRLTVNAIIAILNDSEFRLGQDARRPGRSHYWIEGPEGKILGTDSANLGTIRRLIQDMGVA